MDIEECKRKGHINSTRINKALANSLLEMSQDKEFTVNSANINERTVSSYVSLAYDSMRELLEAYCVLHGYKVTNHICLGELVKKLHSEFPYNDFDRYRYIRNGINYYGKKVDVEEGKELIKKILHLKAKMEEEVRNLLK
jgi:hypothetical protein